MYKASIFIILLAFSSLGWAQEPSPPPSEAPASPGRDGTRHAPQSGSRWNHYRHE